MSNKGSSLSNPYGNSAQSRAANSYKTNSYQGLSQRELMARIYQKAIQHLYLARDAYLAKNLESMVEQNGKAIHILDVLREDMLGSEAMQDPEASETARYLIRTYADWISRIANLLHTKPPEEAFEKLIEDVKEVYKAWVPPKAEEGQPAATTEAVPISVSTSS